MATRSEFQGYKILNMTKGDMRATAGDLTITEADLADCGGGAAKFVLLTGTLGAAGIDVLSIHASDTAGFTPAAGNLVQAFTGSNLPDGTDDGKVYIVDVANVAKYGRYWNAIVTAGANACDASLHVIYLPTQSANTDAEQGAAEAAYVVG